MDAKDKNLDKKNEAAVSETLLELQDQLKNVLFTMDFYREAVDAIISQSDTSSLPTESQKNGLSLFGDWIVNNLDSVEQQVEALRLSIEKHETKHIKERSAQYYFLKSVA